MGIIGSMGKIKSAWEIALEKTASIELDKERYQHDADVDKARRIAGSYLIDDESSREETEKELSGIDRGIVREALRTTVLQSLSLPQDEILDDRYERLSFLASLASGDDPSVMDLMGQIIGFLRQYPKHRKDLVEKMKVQYEPMLAEKEERLRAQYGQNIKLKAENDKEFIELATKNLERLQDQYEKSLQGAKEQLRSLLS